MFSSIPFKENIPKISNTHKISPKIKPLAQSGGRDSRFVEWDWFGLSAMISFPPLAQRTI
jgi:hypothetical protein